SYYTAVSRDGRFAASGSHEDHKVRIWEIATGKEVVQLRFDEKLITGLAFSPNSKMLASTRYAGVVQLWDIATGKELRRMAEKQDEVNRVAFTPDGKILTTASSDAGGDHTIRFWDPATGKELRPLETGPWSASDIAFSPDGQILAAAGDLPERHDGPSN